MNDNQSNAKRSCYDGIEFQDTKETGRVLTFLAASRECAVAACLYTERLSNWAANIGPTGFVVHSGLRRIVFPKTKGEYNDSIILQ